MRRLAMVLLGVAWAGACSGAWAGGQTASGSGNAGGQEVAPAVAEAEGLIAKQDWKGAEAGLAGWLTGHPDDARALFDAGYVADTQNRTEDAAAFYGRAVKADPQSLEAHLSLGLLLAREGKFAEARPELETATKLEPGRADAGTTGPGTSDHEQATGTADRGPATGALRARAWRALAKIDRKDDPAKASEELMAALKLSAETPRDTLLAAELAEGTNEPEAAEAAYKRVLAGDAKNAEARAGLAHLLLARKQHAEAETLLRAALADAPGDPVLTAELATALAAQDKAEALPLLKDLHAAHPEDANVTRMLAEVMAEAGDAAGSDQLATALLGSNPKDEGLLVTHGQNLVKLQKYEEASSAFEKATVLDPADADAWSGLAFASSKAGHPSVTLHALTVRSKLVAENASTYFLWATSYDMLHDREAAKKYYQEFLGAAAGKFPDQEWQARQRLQVLEKKR